MVDIFYDVNDADGDTMSITMQVSDDAGATWDFSCINISGDMNDIDVLSESGKHIIWDFSAEYPQTFSDQIQIKIIADDKQLEWGTVVSFGEFDEDNNLTKNAVHNIVRAILYESPFENRKKNRISKMPR